MSHLACEFMRDLYFVEMQTRAGNGSVGQIGHNFGWVTWFMVHSMLTHYHSQHMPSFYGSAQKRVLQVPASSAESERHFSAFNAHNIITAQRNRTVCFLKLYKLYQFHLRVTQTNCCNKLYMSKYARL